MVVAHAGQPVSLTQIFIEVFDSVKFVPSESDVRASLEKLLKEESQLIKSHGDAYAWEAHGQAPSVPSAPSRVEEMLRRRLQGQTLDEIGLEFDLTRERVRQILKQHGGPSAKEVRNLRATQVRLTQVDRDAAATSEIRAALKDSKPMSAEEVAELTGLDAADVWRSWPRDLSHLRLWGTGKITSRWTDAEILAALQEASTYEFPLTTTAYRELIRVGQVVGPSVPRIGQRFGSWSAACAEAGVVSGERPNRNYESKWSDEDLLKIVLTYLLDPQSPNSAHRFDDWRRQNAPDGPSAQTLRNRFGSWTELKRRALALKG
ncbi:sigma factor-like helix-turn-helix DNA-binding protein [Microlunatus flavus]|uniref:sigma factor-like helix-turn-helix DNA-binding protein n=1 Tax=Microlunatus flavus TaxID=1036181 RepID=UPI000B87300D|nr:sigma factor-like helix-turn-helix DNA-binding protein [Microlunatus flavus]